MNSQSFEQFDKYEYLEAEFYRHDRQYRRRQQRRQARRDRPEIEEVDIRSELTDFNYAISDFVPSYAAALDPLHFERQWIINSLGGFYQDNLITDVTRIVKGGKEANVYCCIATPPTGVELIAAKLYRPRMLRHLRNDALYKEGRILLDGDGKETKGDREARAIRKKTRFGQQLDFLNWIMHEFEIQKELFDAGVLVPKPIAHRGNALLMSFVGDEWSPAPTLNEVSLPSGEAQLLFELTMNNIRLMLSHHYVHGDLSAYNILYWEGQIQIIDFPQVVDARKNRNAFMLLERDVRRVCQYFDRYGVKNDPASLMMEMWQTYMDGLL